MLRTTCPNISVITNFGCRANCWYCIWKSHELENINNETDWLKLEKFISDNKDKGKVSLSGGGDPLHKYNENAKWWNNFLSITNKYNMLVDIHTREKFTNFKWFDDNINRCVFSSDNPDDDKMYLKILSNHCKVRVTHLVTADTSFNVIDEYLRLQREIKCQFTIKELIGHDDGGMYNKIKKAYPDIFHLDYGDYNIYYMPDNSIKNSFL
jgi:organic radical activating enzyme